MWAQLDRWKEPGLLLFLLFLAFGLQIASLGFYFDDWPVIYQIKTSSNFWTFYRYDRPFSAWTYYLLAPLLGTQPLLWHLTTLILRWLTCVALWWTLQMVWPHHRRDATWVAALFAVYPVFFQQSISVAYSQHFMTYALFFISCGTMLAAIRNRKGMWWLGGISLLSAATHIFTMEYFWGLELVRPFLIWFALGEQQKTSREKFTQVVRHWLPYLVILIAALLIRHNYFANTTIIDDDPNALRLLDMVRNDPGPGILHLFEMVAKDFVYLMFTAWSKTLAPNLIDFRSPSSNFTWFLVLLTIFILWFTLWRNEPSGGKPAKRLSWGNQALILGVVIYLVGTAPIWVTDEFISAGMYSDRFGLPAMWAGSMILVGLLTHISLPKRYRSLLISILIALSIGAHFRTSNDYRWDWVQQKRFFWQLYWRVPSLEPNTALFADGTVFTYVGDYPLSFAINTAYSQPTVQNDLPYWFFELDRGFHQESERYLAGARVKGNLRNFTFEGNSLNSIVLDYNFGKGNCLWLLDENDRFNVSLPGLTWEALPLSNFGRILPANGPDRAAYAQVFGSEPDHDWCFYFQKASYARQNGDWEAIIQMEPTLESQGYQPNNQLEWTPFIQAHAALGHWEMAKKITLNAYRRSPITQKSFCGLWSTFGEVQSDEPDKALIIMRTMDSLACH
jgi:hypothetical protein